MATTKKPPIRFVRVNLRLFEDDVFLVKRLADEQRIPWQVLARLIFHDAALSKKTKVIE